MAALDRIENGRRGREWRPNAPRKTKSKENYMVQYNHG